MLRLFAQRCVVVGIGVFAFAFAVVVALAMIVVVVVDVSTVATESQPLHVLSHSPDTKSHKPSAKTVRH